LPTIIQIDKQSHLTGQTMRTLLEAQELHRRGYRVILACQPGSFLERSGRERSLEILPLRMNYFLPSLIKLVFFLRRERVDLINAHGYPDHFLCAVARKITGVRVLVRTKHNHVPLKSGALSRYLYGTLTSRIVTISEHIREVMISSGLSPDQVTTIRTAINLSQFVPREKDPRLLEELNLPAGCAIIGIVARLTERKGFKHLFEAVRLLADQGRTLRCLVVGGGASKEKIAALKNYAASLGVSEQILLTGRRSDIPDILSLLEVFILPSLAEGLGRSMLEAMAAGRAIVATTVGGIPEAIEDGKSGILVPPGDPRALAQAIGLLLDNPLKARELGRASRARAELLFDETKMIDGICALYEELLTDGQPDPARPRPRTPHP
jgi:glycosyltransferase involved in cell wall biosynthesis